MFSLKKPIQSVKSQNCWVNWKQHARRLEDITVPDESESLGVERRAYQFRKRWHKASSGHTTRRIKGPN
jgi:hypothetical protein